MYSTRHKNIIHDWPVDDMLFYIVDVTCIFIQCTFVALFLYLFLYNLNIIIRSIDMYSNVYSQNL